MSARSQAPPKDEIVYPDSDGQPTSENTLQFEWITTIKGGLDALFSRDPDVFVAGDLLWYPVEGHPEIRSAPDALVVFGRPKGYRGSYQQWREDGIAPQVVFEVLSPGNRPMEMVRKFHFYERYGVEEYYLYDPDLNEFGGWLRQDGLLREIGEMDGWVSPRLGIRFHLGATLTIVGSDGRAFATYVELAHERNALAHERDALAQQVDAERERAERLAKKLRELGVEP